MYTIPGEREINTFNSEYSGLNAEIYPEISDYLKAAKFNIDVQAVFIEV